MKRTAFLCFLIAQIVPFSDSSAGDAHPDFRQCVAICGRTVCDSQKFLPDQGFIDKITNWRCLDQCVYDCMWRTVALFQKQYKRIPQFFGKWPFVRFLGMQEPAAAIFSLLNLLAHFQLLRRFIKQIKPEAPMRNVWILYGLVSINAWICSTVFHSRDVALTEKLDYFSAFSIVVYSLLAFFMRILGMLNSTLWYECWLNFACIIF